MPTTSFKGRTIMVDSLASLRSLLDQIINLPRSPPSLFFDLEGIKLGRHGSISIISLCVAPENTVHLIDVYRLGSDAFSTASNSTTLKDVLESACIPKVFFDIRNDSDALYSHYGVSVNGIKDLQLMELGSRKGSKDFVASLAKCVEKDGNGYSTEKVEWQRTKDSAIWLFSPDRGGRYEIFNERPLEPEITHYCAEDVAILPHLYKVYDATLQPPGEMFWRVEIEKATAERIKLSQSHQYNGQASDKARGPWDKWYIEQAMEEWNDDVMFRAMHEDTRDEEDGDDDWYQDSARDCIGWEEDMIKNGEPF